MNTIRKTLRFLFANKFFDTILIVLIYLTGRNPLLFVYNLRGISKWQNDSKSGELFLIKKYLPNYFKRDNLVLFDIGANVGNYTLKLQKYFPNSMIYSFEPNPKTYELLIETTKEFKNITNLNVGLSDNNEVSKIYSYASEEASEHASLYENVISDLHHDKNIASFDIVLEKLDDFCAKNKIEKIDLLKIDTEGHELAVFKGAKRFIDNKLIDVIQFEFNAMNVISRTFLKDFYDIASTNYDFYRLDSKKLIRLGSYSAINEIFQFQNIILLKK
jgi:FkbM family methyltransferase